MLRKPIASVILVIAVIIFGTVTLSRLSIELLPDVTQPTLLVSTEYPGAPAADVEYRINEPLEAALASVRGVQGTRGLARQGQSLVFLTFDWNTDLNLAFLNVREKLDLARAFLPQQAARPQLIYSSASDHPIATLGLSFSSETSESFESRLLLKRWTEQVFSRRLEQQEGIAQALLVGEVRPEVHIRYNPKILDRYGISLTKVQQVVREANMFSSTGELRDGWYRYALKIQSRIESLEDIRNIPVVSLANGRVLLLHEIAEVVLDEADPTSFALVNNHDVLNVLVKKEYGANTVTVYKTLLQTLDEIRNQNPDIDVRVIREDATYIENSISNLLQTLIIGGVLAFIVLFLFLDDMSSPFTISISIPVSIFLTFIVMYLFEIQLNIISLSGLTLGIGLLVDNSIVVLENINRHKALGLDRFTAAKKGTEEIALAVTASTFTTVSVFLPLIFLGGFEGAFFRDLAATLTISLVASLLVALIILPVFVAQFSGKGGLRFLTKIVEGLNHVLRKYERSLVRFIGKPASVFIVLAALTLAVFWIFLTMEKQTLPEGEPTRLEYLVTMPGNTALRSAKEASIFVSSLILKEMPDAEVLSVGGYTDNTSLNSFQNEGINKFEISVPVKSTDEVRRIESIFAGLAATYQMWSINRLESTNFGETGSIIEDPVQFSIVGTDRALSKRASDALQRHLQAEFVNTELTEKYPQTVDVFQLTLDSDRLLRYGIAEQEVILYLESLTRGSPVTEWSRQDEQISIRLIGDGDKLNDPSDIKLDIQNKVIPLAELAVINPVKEAEQLERLEQSPVLTFNSGYSLMDWWWHAKEIRENVSEFVQKTGFDVQIGGSAPRVIGLLKDLGLLLLISVLLIYLILAIQFENLKYPLIIMFAIPFALFGSFIALFISGLGLNALSFMGILILTGVTVNDSILMVDFMRRYYDKTGNLEEAVIMAGVHRFRPVVMTSLTTILGLVPMLIPLGDGYVLRQSLATALMGGMVTSTVLTLYVIPIIFKKTVGRKSVS